MREYLEALLPLVRDGSVVFQGETFTARAADRSVRTICFQGLKRAEALFQTAVPPEVLTALSAGPSEASAVFVRNGLRPVDRLVADARALGLVGSARLLREHVLPPAHYMPSMRPISCFSGCTPSALRLASSMQGHTIANVCDTMLEEYDVSPDVLNADVTRLVGELRDRGIVTPREHQNA